MNKRTGDLFLGTIWWVHVLNDSDGLFRLGDNYTLANGFFMNVGWLVQNKHGVWFGLNTKDDFEDLGDA